MKIACLTDNSKRIWCSRSFININVLNPYNQDQQLLPNYYWVDQKGHSEFSIAFYRKTWTNLLASPIFLTFYRRKLRQKEMMTAQSGIWLWSPCFYPNPRHPFLMCFFFFFFYKLYVGLKKKNSNSSFLMLKHERTLKLEQGWGKFNLNVIPDLILSILFQVVLTLLKYFANASWYCMSCT